MHFSGRERFREQLAWKIDGRGRRVKPRVRAVVWLFGFILLAFFILPFVGAFVAIDVFRLYGPRSAFNTEIFLYAVMLAFILNAVGRLLLPELFLWLGWLTREEAREIRWMGSRYPKSCWEPPDEEE